jgi:hypothetical protein
MSKKDRTPFWRLEPRHLQHCSGLVVRAEESVLCEPVIDWVHLVIVLTGGTVARVAEISHVPRSKVQRDR